MASSREEELISAGTDIRVSSSSRLWGGEGAWGQEEEQVQE